MAKLEGISSWHVPEYDVLLCNSCAPAGARIVEERNRIVGRCLKCHRELPDWFVPAQEGGDQGKLVRMDAVELRALMCQPVPCAVADGYRAAAEES